MQRSSGIIGCVLVAVLLLTSVGWWMFRHRERQLHQQAHSRVRDQLDALAMQVPSHDFKRKSLNWSGDLTGWLVSKIQISAAEERDLAEERHQQIVKHETLVDVPEDVAQVLDQLNQNLPTQFLPTPQGFSVTIVGGDLRQAYSSGGEHLYLSETWLKKQGAVGTRAPLVAFHLAHEMGHVCRRHSREGYELLVLNKGNDFSFLSKLGVDYFKKAYTQMVHKIGDVVQFAYDERQEQQADLFAIHLCRNAGLNVEHCLDALRFQALQYQPGWQTDAEDGELSDDTLPAAMSEETLDALRRLAGLRVELDGQVPGAEFGLYEFDSSNQSIEKTDGEKMIQADRIVVVVHGMESNLKGFVSLMKDLAEHDEDCSVLGYQYPNDASMARSAVKLFKEIQQHCPEDAILQFVCHSAGGLVTRYYSEILGGRADQIVFLGTPHYGSDLAKLRSILELKQVISGLSLDFPEALESAMLDGDGQITFDLQPDSLFLKHLNRQITRSENYAIFRGLALSETRANQLKKGLSGAISVGKLGLLPLKLHKTGRRALAYFEGLQIPAEITEGDLAVTLESAALPGVGKLETVERDHITLTRDAKVIQQTLEFLDAQ